MKTEKLIITTKEFNALKEIYPNIKEHDLYGGMEIIIESEE